MIPVSDKYLDYARRVAAELEDAEVRLTIDDRNETLGRKIRDIASLTMKSSLGP